LSKRQPITTKPELGEVNSMSLVTVGTGRYLGASDLSDDQPQTVYTIKDVTNGVVPPTPVDARGSNVVEQVITDTTDGLGNPIRTITANAVDLATKDGWRVDLPISGERVNVDPKLQLGTLIVQRGRQQDRQLAGSWYQRGAPAEQEDGGDCDHVGEQVSDAGTAVPGAEPARPAQLLARDY
jgi:Tfp pilus tip-associated adhesin PilY1